MTQVGPGLQPPALGESTARCSAAHLHSQQQWVQCCMSYSAAAAVLDPLLSSSSAACLTHNSSRCSATFLQSEQQVQDCMPVLSNRCSAACLYSAAADAVLHACTQSSRCRVVCLYLANTVLHAYTQQQHMQGCMPVLSKCSVACLYSQQQQMQCCMSTQQMQCCMPVLSSSRSRAVCPYSVAAGTVLLHTCTLNNTIT